MPHRDPHHRSDPETTFDTWLDAFVAGTPANGASQDDPSGPLTRAQAGARQLHGLAVQAATPATAVQQRIREDLMHSGALAASGGMTRLHERRREKQVPWWSPTSPVLATALAIAVIVGLVTSLVWMQRPVSLPGTSDAPGFAVASPEASQVEGALSCSAPGYVPVVAGAPDGDAMRQIGFEGEPIVQTDAGYDIPESVGTVGSIEGDIRESGHGFVIHHHDDGTASAIRIRDGETWTFADLDAPNWPYPETQIALLQPYLVGPENEEGSNWLIIDMRTGESATTSEITGSDAGGYISPDSVTSNIRDGVGRIVFSRIQYSSATPDDTDSSPLRSSGQPFAVFLPGSLDGALALPNQPSRSAQSGLVASESGRWFATDTTLYDGSTGENAGNLYTEISRAGKVVGFLDEGSPTLLVQHQSTIYLVDPLADTDEEIYTHSEPIRRITYTPDTGTMLIWSGPQPEQSATWLNANTGEAHPVPELASLDAQQFSRTAIVVDTVAHVESPMIFVERASDDTQQFGALYTFDMETGTLSQAASNARLTRYEDGIATYLGWEQQGFIAGELNDNRFLVIDSSTNDRFEFGRPEGLSLQEGWSVRYSLSPDGTCVSLRVLDETRNQVGNTWIAPLEQGAEWTELDIQLVDWWQLSDVPEEPQTLPAQDFATPFASEGIPSASDATPAATPAATGDLDGVVIVEGDAEQARIEGDVAIATLDESGLTLPLANGASVTIPGDPQASLGNLDSRLVVHIDGQGPTVVDQGTGEVVHALPEYRPFSQWYARWHMIPTDDTLVDWIIVDTDTGETRLLSGIVDLPGDEPVMPAAPMFNPMSETNVFEIQQGSIDGRRWIPESGPLTHIGIAGSPDRIVELHDYPTILDRTGEPALVEASEGRLIAYETRAGNDRIVVVDTIAGQELVRYGVDTVGEDPMLAGFADDDTLVIAAENSVVALSTRGGSADVVRDGLDDIDNPLLHTPDGVLYLRQGNTLLQLVLESGETSEVASGIVPGSFGFTKPGSSWITFQTQEGYALVDARSGEVVSHVQPPANRAKSTDAIGIDPSLTSAEGDTVIVALDPFVSTRPNDEPGGAVWLLSPAYSDGREIAGPTENAATGGFWLSPEGTTLYAWTSESMSGRPRSMWATSIGGEPSWSRIAESAGFKRFIPLDAGDS